MYVVGLTSRIRPAPVVASQASSEKRRVGRKSAPRRAASRSANQNPALCRVPSYFGPGLPRPTTSSGRIAVKRRRPTGSCYGAGPPRASQPSSSEADSAVSASGAASPSAARAALSSSSSSGTSSTSVTRDIWMLTTG